MINDFFSFLQKSAEKRQNLQKFTNALRLVNGGADGFPGFTLDQYGTHFQVQFFSEKLLVQENQICEEIQRLFSPEYLVVKYRLSPSGKDLEHPEFRVVCGLNPETIVQEGNCLFQYPCFSIHILQLLN